MTAPTIGQLQEFTRQTFRGDDLARAYRVMSTVRQMVNAYTRGAGFTDGCPNDDLQAVILTATVRMLAVPAGVQSETMGPFSVQYTGAGGFSWTVAEQYVLDRYRVKAM